MRFFTKCSFCKQKRLYVNHRYIKVPPTGVEAKSKIEMCGQCYSKVLKMIKT